ncbi:MAG: hypothetical protein AAGI68_07855 [Planctomycetota bacterium]
MRRSILPVLIAALTCIVLTTDAIAIYHPGLGRFAQRDPLGYPDGMNGYAGHHVAYQALDPSGLTLRISGNRRVPAATNARFLNHVTDELKKICPDANVDAAGVVTVPPGDNCDGCICLRELADNGFDNLISLPARPTPPRAVPRVRGNENPRPGGRPGPGTAGAVVYDPGSGFDERDQNAQGPIDPNGHPPLIRTPQFIILAHELCGHVLYFNSGTQVAPGPPPFPGATPPHEVDAQIEENKIRAENNIQPRPDYVVPRRYPW